MGCSQKLNLPSGLRWITFFTPTYFGQTSISLFLFVTAGSYLYGRAIAEYCNYRSCDLISAFFICQYPLLGLTTLIITNGLQKKFHLCRVTTNMPREGKLILTIETSKVLRYAGTLYIFLSFQTSTCTQESRRCTDNRCDCQQHPDWCGSPRSCLHGYLAHRAKRGQWRQPQLFMILYPAIMMTDATSVNHPWLKMEVFQEGTLVICFARRALKVQIFSWRMR